MKEIYLNGVRVITNHSDCVICYVYGLRSLPATHQNKFAY